ncbi:MAG: sigma-70 family RNA polymerase sigma factor [Candidatus Brocadiae bacterium]|nr:sigma-70 family RNA polymerase sigma factor [Candidatus Brocadiia bacterium]
MGTLSDDELVRMYREGDADAFDTLFDRYHTSVYNFARVMLNGPEGAEEVMQEAFLAVARTAKTYTPRGLFRPWLMRIVRNLCLNRLRTERLRRRVLAEGGIGVLQVASPEPAAPELLERDERMAMLRRSIRRLPERQREAIVLYAFEQMSYREIADALEVPMNTVKTLIHRARANLAREFEENPDDA